MDDVATTAGRTFAAESAVGRRLRALARVVPPPEIAELWIFPPLADLESSAEFFLFTRFLEGERRVLCSVRLRRENGSPETQVVVEHGSVPADHIPRLVERLRRRLEDEGEPFHAVIDGCEGRWRELFGPGAERTRDLGSTPDAGPPGAGGGANGAGHGPRARNGVWGNGAGSFSATCQDPVPPSASIDRTRPAR